MKRWTFLFLLLLGSQAWADWNFIGRTPEFTMYGDPTSIQRHGTIAKVWVMGDYKTVQSSRFPPPLLWLNYQSVKELKEYDCANGWHRTVRTAVFAARLAKGDPLYTFDSGATFAPMVSTPIDLAQFQFGCEDGKR
jgi:hypothetical protein